MSSLEADPHADLSAAPPVPRQAVAQPRPLWPIGLWALILVLCVTPFVLVLAISFGQKIEGASWEWAFTWANYQRFFVGTRWPEEVTALYLQKLYFSIYYAVIAASLAVVTAWLKETGWFDVLRQWGSASPRNVKFKTSDFATVLTMSYLVWPYAVILLYPALSRLDQSMLEAARTMGARPWTVMRTVVLPSVRLPVIGTLVLLFVFLMGSYVVVTVFAEPARQTLAVSVYEAVRGATLNAPFGAAQAVVLLIAAAICLGLGQWLSQSGARV